MSGFGYNVLGFGANASSAAGDPVDDEFNRVSFLSHFDGSNNGVNNSFDDGSTSNHTITVYGDATQGSFGPFARPDGEWAVNLGSSTNTLRAVGAGDISGDFTVETWVFMNKDNGNYIHLTYNSGGIVNVFNVYNGSVQNFLFGTSSTAGQTTLEFNDTTWDAGVWTHLAMVRSSGTLKIYVNGVADATTSTAVSGNLTDLEYIGTGRSFTSDARIFDGKVSNVRFSSTARYTSNFTPPTAPFATDSDTNLLTCQSNRFVDNSSNGHTITPTGNPSVIAFGPFLTSAVYDAAVNGASGYFSSNDSGFTDGTADLLDLGVDADFNFGTGDFSIEYWAYFQGFGGVAFAAHTTGDASGFYAFDNPPRFELFNGGGQVSTGETPPKNAWYHFVLSRQSGTLRVFANGVLKASATNTGSISQDGKRFCVGGILSVSGSNARNYGLKGYLTDFRVVKGSCAAAYQTSSTTNGAVIFTPPTAPVTAVTNTKLLLNMKDGQAIDSAAQNNLTLVNDAKTSTTRAKFGNTSLYLDGSDYAIIENSQSRAFGTGDFTVEFFIWLNGSPDQFDYIFDMRSSSDLTYTWALSFNYMGSATNDELQWASNNTSPNAILRAVYPSLNQWVHIAVCRSGTTTRMFYDGTQVAINTSDSADYRDTGYQGYIGCRHSIGNYIDAYMDEIRFSKMARYTANFTAPTKAFADKGQ